MNLIRSFIALYPDPDAREHMAGYVSRLKARVRDIRWEHPEKVHITLKFLGDVDPSTLDALTEDLRARIAADGPITASINRTGAFPNLRRPRIVWLGFTEAPRRVLTLQELAEAVCGEHGLEREKKDFTPHFTIGRVKNHARIESLENDLEACSFQSATVHFSAVRIMESTLTPQGAIHRERARISLIPGE